MAQGRTKVYYVSDILTVFDNTGAGAPAAFFTEVPNNLVAQAAVLGWSATPPSGVPTDIPLKKGKFKPRHVVGVAVVGGKAIRVRADVATTTATIWTGVASTWDFIDNNGTTQTATRTSRIGEAAPG